VLVANPSIRTIAVVAADSTWYVLSKARSQQHADARTVVRSFTAAAISLSRRYLALARSGALTHDDAIREFSHHIWRRIATPLGLRYDRMQ
jgi:hypothetical protein